MRILIVPLPALAPTHGSQVRVEERITNTQYIRQSKVIWDEIAKLGGINKIINLIENLEEVFLR
ncbi:MAG: hypothetical protein E7231_17265 [Cellulosilyticum sp.]|nr:hypothetical protein [Cellulosilyticum sp.]